MILTSADVMANSAIALANHKAEKNNNKLLRTSKGVTDTEAKKERDAKRELVQTDNLPGLDIVGPRGTDAFIHSLRHFMRREKFELRVHTGDYKQQPTSKKPSKRQRSSKHNQGVEEKEFHMQSIACEMPSGQQVLSYIFISPPVPGKFLVQKAIELGIPKGPLYAQLKNGIGITFIHPETGVETRVESSQVVEAGVPGVAVVILFYPSIQILNQLKVSQPLVQLFSMGDSSSTSEKGKVEVDVVIHMTPHQCFESTESSSWRMGLDENIEHIHLDTDLPAATMDPGTHFHSTAAGAKCRSRLSEDIFITPSGPPKQCSTDVLREHRKASPLLEYILIPRSKRGFRNVDLHEQHQKAIEEEMMSLLESSGAIELANEALPTPTLVPPRDSAEIIFTGTGSAIPCKHRNVSGIFLQVDNKNAMLLDAGEGTFGQLARAKQYECSTEELLRRIKAVWISHPHADHHLGILRLLSERKRILGHTEKPLILITQKQICDFLLEYENVDPFVKGSFNFIDCKMILKSAPPALMDVGQRRTLERLKTELGITSIYSTPVQHCAHSYAVSIHGTPFGMLAYSGDCRPSGRFAADALSCDLLIHEATFTDGMEDEAALKRHCTVGEALDIATRMNAKSVILSHFSQRFPKIPPVSGPSAEEPEIPIIFAFDYLRITPQNIVAASKITPALRLLYPEQSSKVFEAEDEGVIEKAMNANVLSTPGLFAQKEIL